jgi:hypothetical protein
VRYAWEVAGRRRQTQAGRLAMVSKTVLRGHRREIWLISEGRGREWDCSFQISGRPAPLVAGRLVLSTYDGYRGHDEDITNCENVFCNITVQPERRLVSRSQLDTSPNNTVAQKSWAKT